MKYDYLKQSPVRRVLEKCQDGLSIFELEKIDYKETDSIQKEKTVIKDILNDIEIVLKSIEAHCNDKLRIAVLGEVKAGKSTFINACVGKEIAYTDVLEATAIVSEITYSEEEYVRIIDKEGKIAVVCDFEELLELMEEKTDELEYFKNLDKVEIGVNNEILKNIILVDTPGLLSITAENQYVTNKYIYQADYFFWVINCTNLGDEAVNDKLNEIKSMGKTIIGIINQVDTQEIKKEIEEYIEENYRIVFEELFFVSSKRAWRGIVNENRDELQKSGFDNLLEYLEDLAEDGKEIKKYNNSNSEYYQLKKEYDLHNKIIQDLETKKNYYDGEQCAIRTINQEIKTKIEEDLKRWINKEVYLSEKTKMLNATGEELIKYYKEYSTSEYITEVVDRKYSELIQYISEQWTDVQKQWVETPSQVLIDFNYQDNLDMQSKEVSTDSKKKKTAGMIEGAKIGVQIGTVLAGYAAWLGPAAAAVTMGSALISIAIPVAIGGAIIGRKVSSNNDIQAMEMEKNAKEKERKIEKLYKEVQKCISSSTKQLKKELYMFTDQYSEELCKSMREKVAKLNFDFEKEAYQKFMEDMKNYIDLLEKKIQDNESSQPIEKIEKKDYLKE